jgi:hypothetical protein
MSNRRAGPVGRHRLSDACDCSRMRFHGSDPPRRPFRTSDRGASSCTKGRSSLNQLCSSRISTTQTRPARTIDRRVLEWPDAGLQCRRRLLSNALPWLMSAASTLPNERSRSLGLHEAQSVTGPIVLFAKLHSTNSTWPQHEHVPNPVLRLRVVCSFSLTLLLTAHTSSILPVQRPGEATYRHSVDLTSHHCRRQHAFSLANAQFQPRRFGSLDLLHDGTRAVGCKLRLD